MDIDAFQEARARIHALSLDLKAQFASKDEIVDLLILGLLTQNPVLLLGPPGTAKSALIKALVQGLMPLNFFEYQLTSMTEPSELLGPIDIRALKQGHYLRRTQGMLPQADLAFLDEIFEANSAVLNLLLSILNERVFYQDGQAIPMPLVTLFAASNHWPLERKFEPFLDRMTWVVLSEQVHERAWESLLEKGMQNAFQNSPLQKRASLQDFKRVRQAFEQHLQKSFQRGLAYDREMFFPKKVYEIWKAILQSLEGEGLIQLSDRQIIRIYRALRAWAFFKRNGQVQGDDLFLLRYISPVGGNPWKVKVYVDQRLKQVDFPIPLSTRLTHGLI